MAEPLVADAGQYRTCCLGRHDRAAPVAPLASLWLGVGGFGFLCILLDYVDFLIK